MKMISEEEAARRIGRSKRFIYRLRKTGEISFLPSSGGRSKVMILEDSLNQWLKERMCQQTKGENESRHTSCAGTACSMSASMMKKKVEADAKALGQQIWRKRKRYSLGG
jgi:excisionase family DNA binding protein